MNLTPSQFKRLQKQSNRKLDSLVKNRTGSKLSNKTVFYNGNKYDSVGEKDYAVLLDLRVKAGDIKSWERQVKIDLKVNGTHVTNYYIDFIITHNDGTLELVEYKGMVMPLWVCKFNLLKALMDELYPGAKLTVVKHESKYKPKSTWNKQSPK